MKKYLSLILLIGLVALLVGATLFYKTAELNLSGGFLLPIIVIASLVDSINPCAFSVLLLTVGFLFSLGRDRKEILKIGATYIIGIFLVYILIGLGILQALQIFGIPHVMALLGAVILILYGVISLLGNIFPSFPIKLKIPDAAHRRIAMLMEKGSIPGAFLLGGAVGLFEFPCTGGPYLMVLGLLHDQGTFLKGLGYLVLYNFIFVFPLIIILCIASDKSLLARAKEWQKKDRKYTKFLGDVILILLGLVILYLAI